MKTEYKTMGGLTQMEHNDIILRAEQSRAEQSRAEQLDYCNFIKVILMLLVVLYHSVALWLPNGWFNQAPEHRSAFLGGFASWLNSFHVYGFVLVSGYIFAFLKFEKKKYRTIGLLIVNKTKRLLIPYAFVLTAWVAPWHWFYFRSSFSEVIYKYFLGCNPSQLWFLLMLFLVFTLAYLLSGLIKRKPLYGLLLAIILYLAGIIGQSMIENYYQIFTACIYFIFFVIGMLLRILKGEKFLMSIPIPIYVIVDAVLFIIYSSMSDMEAPVFKAINLGITLVLHLIGALMAFTVLSWVAKRIDNKTKGAYKNFWVFKFLNTHSFTIYLFHQQVIYGVITLLNGKVPSVIMAIANFVIAIGVSSIIAVVLSKWKVTRVLIGQK